MGEAPDGRPLIIDIPSVPVNAKDLNAGMKLMTNKPPSTVACGSTAATLDPPAIIILSNSRPT